MREGDWCNRKELPSGYVLCSDVEVAVSHLISDFFGVGSWWFVEQGGASLGEFAFSRQGRKVGHIVVRVRGMVVRFRFPFSCWEVPWFRPEGSSSALEPLSVQARVSGDVTPDRADGNEPSSTAFGMCVRRGTREEKTSFRSGESGGVWRARLQRFIWQTRNDGQNWIRKPNSLVRCKTKENIPTIKMKTKEKNTKKTIIIIVKVRLTN